MITTNLHYLLIFKFMNHVETRFINSIKIVIHRDEGKLLSDEGIYRNMDRSHTSVLADLQASADECKDKCIRSEV